MNRRVMKAGVMRTGFTARLSHEALGHVLAIKKDIVNACI